MLATLRKRFDRDDEEGFTLIELMVVVLIIAILLAIAIPTFLGARERANDRAAQSSLRNALTAAKTLYTDSQTYQSAQASDLPAVEPSLSYSTTSSSTFKQVAVTASGASEWYGAALSKSGVCFVIRDVATTSGGGTFFAKATNSNCQTTTVNPTSATSW
jgi:type IV pilus assembly protein PilA